MQQGVIPQKFHHALSAQRLNIFHVHTYQTSHAVVPNKIADGMTASQT